ncbi:hypothetical protein [Filifactor alocis]
MKKWIDEHVFLIDAIFFFGLFPLTYIAYLYKQELWKNEFIIALSVVVILVDRYLKPFIKEKEVYCVDVRNVIMIVTFVFSLFFLSLREKVDKQSFLGFLSMYPFSVILFLFPIEQLLNHRNYVNGIEVEKYDFWSQEERKKKKELR